MMTTFFMDLNGIATSDIDEMLEERVPDRYEAVQLPRCYSMIDNHAQGLTAYQLKKREA